MAEIKFELPGSLIFGNKEILRLGSEASIWGERVLIITDSVHKSTGTLDFVKDILEKKRLKVLIYSDVKPSASTFSIEEAISLARSSHTQVIVGLGGVRALSFAKAVAFVAAGDGNIDDFFSDKVNRRITIPLLQVPTSLRNPFLLTESCFITESRQRTSAICHLPPGSTKQIIVDPSLTISLPAKYTLLALMEILLSSIEAYIGMKSSFLVETSALEAINKVTANISAIAENQGNLNLRKLACEASVNAAMAFAMTGPLPGLMLSYTTGSYFKVSRASVASILYPYIFDSSLYNNSEKLKGVAEILKRGLHWNSLGASDGLSSVLRSMIARFKLPIRLGDLKIDVNELSICSDIAETIIMKNQNKIGADSLFEILKEAY
ncbi:MAG: iron-containing alcohol dehydrogenase [Spirochaetaceae bacterium]|jgi:alcohol dehydrogenase class IV|nr:iron-containing alcohol dehydrogenase [Spirochaetaceae bacterium]